MMMMMPPTPKILFIELLPKQKEPAPVPFISLKKKTIYQVTSLEFYSRKFKRIQKRAQRFGIYHCWMIYGDDLGTGAHVSNL